MNVLVVDIGGTHVKVLANDQTESRQFNFGPALLPKPMALGSQKIAEGWSYGVVSIGYPGPVLRNRPVAEPHNLGRCWVGFDYEAAFRHPVKLINDAAMQASGSYRGGKILFPGFGTGLGSTMIMDGIIEPMELGHLPYKRYTYEDYVGQRGLGRVGKHKWRPHVADFVARLVEALEPEMLSYAEAKCDTSRSCLPAAGQATTRTPSLGEFDLGRTLQSSGVVMAVQANAKILVTRNKEKAKWQQR